jgi:hypothetical protein
MQKGVNNILNERQNQYGSAEQNFTDIGIIWGALLRIEQIPAYQIALMMDALKTVRCFNNPSHKDSWIDKLGYTEHGYEIVLNNES